MKVHKTIAAVLFILTAWNTTTAQAETPSAVVSNPCRISKVGVRSVGDIEEKIQDVSNVLETLSSQDKFYGHVRVSDESGQVRFSKAYGIRNRKDKAPNTEDTRFHIGSVTKQFTSAILIVLVRESKISLKDSLKKFFPHVPKQHEDITIFQLLTHSSGLGDLDVVPEDVLSKLDPNIMEPIVDVFLQYPRKVAAGTFYYSNFGYSLLARVIELVTGSRYEEVVHNKIFKPLGMVHTGFPGESVLDPVPVSYSYGDAETPETRADQMIYDWMGYRGADGVVTNANDLHIWMRKVFLEDFFTAEEKTMLWTPYLMDQDAGPNSWYGLGWMLTVDPTTNAVKRIYHVGGADYGFIAFDGYDVENNYFISFFMNLTDPMDGFRAVDKIFRQ